MKDEKKPYKVGYKKPPKTHQFKKGKSGNPQGRTKGSKNLPSLYRDILEEEIYVTESGKPKIITKQEAIVRRVFSDALRGKDTAIDRVLEHAPKNEDEEQRYTMAELGEMLNWDALNQDELDVVAKLLNRKREGGA